MDVVYSLCENVVEMSEGKVVNYKKTYDYFAEKINDENAVIPEIFRFCSVFEEEAVKKARNIEQLLEALSHEWFCFR